MNDDVELLAWPSWFREPTALSQLFFDFPIWGAAAVARRQFCQTLRNRCWADVERELEASTSSIRKRLAETIATCIGWPTPYFLLADPCDILFWDPSIDLRDVEALCDVSRGFGVEVELDWSFGELLEQVVIVEKCGESRRENH